MNRRTSKLLDHVVNALMQAGEKNLPKKGDPLQLFNPARNLKRKLAGQWNAKPRNTRGAERLGVIRTLVSMHEAANG
jgi:hypothetical protein